jgi:xanthine dehydrogenase small subunit
VAGGTDLALEVTQFHREIETLINVTQVEDMKVCEESEDALHIGANVAISDAYKLLTSHYADFGELLHRFASLQVRNQGTLGGNIGNASPIGDAPPLLIALNAQVKLRRGKQSRVMPIEDYFISYKVTAQQESEFIEQIIIPKPKSSETFRAYKLSKRLDDDISAVCGAFNIQIEDNKVVNARIAFGGMAATPKRATRCENTLLGKEWNQANIDEAMQEIHNDFEPLSDFRASKEYRSMTAANMLRRFYIEQNHQNNQIETRVTSYV